MGHMAILRSAETTMTSKPFNLQMQWYAESMELLEILWELKLANHPDYMFAWQAGNSPLPGASKFRARLSAKLVPMLIEKRRTRPQVTFRAVSSNQAVEVGCELSSHRPVLIDRDLINRHVVVIGASGIGKTCAVVGWVLRLLSKGISVEFADHKNEAGRLARLYPNTLIIRADQELINIVEPIGPAEIYHPGLFQELAKVSNLRAETWSELPEIMQAIGRSLNPGEPWPSLEDFVEILFKLAKEQHRPKLGTVARAIKSLNVMLGKMARVRRAPDVFERFKLVIRQYRSLPPRIHNFLTAIRVLRLQARGAIEGRSAGLRHVYVSDEGTMEFGREMSSETGSGYVRANKQFITRIRSECVGVIVVTQLYAELDESVKSTAASFMSFCCPNPRDAREALVKLRLPSDMLPSVMPLPVARAYFISEGFSGAALVNIPRLDLGEYPSAGELNLRMQPALLQLERDSIFSEPKEGAVISITSITTKDTTSALAEPPKSPPAISSDEKLLFEEIKKTPGCGITELIKCLGWSFRRFDRAKRQLLERRMIRVDHQTSTNGRPKDILSIL